MLQVTVEWLNVGDNPPAWVISSQPAADTLVREPHGDYDTSSPYSDMEALRRDLARSRAEISDLQQKIALITMTLSAVSEAQQAQRRELDALRASHRDTGDHELEEVVADLEELATGTKHRH